jgi:hypothetical protein
VHCAAPIARCRTAGRARAVPDASADPIVPVGAFLPEQADRRAELGAAPPRPARAPALAHTRARGPSAAATASPMRPRCLCGLHDAPRPELAVRVAARGWVLRALCTAQALRPEPKFYCDWRLQPLMFYDVRGALAVRAMHNRTAPATQRMHAAARDSVLEHPCGGPGPPKPPGLSPVRAVLAAVPVGLIARRCAGGDGCVRRCVCARARALCVCVCCGVCVTATAPRSACAHSRSSLQQSALAGVEERGPRTSVSNAAEARLAHRLYQQASA